MDRREAQGDDVTRCPDCGIDAWYFEEDGTIVHEDFYVSDELWDAVAPDDGVVRWTHDSVEFGQGRFVLCIGCFERRLGRQLTADDLGATPDTELRWLGDIGPSRSYLARWRGQ